MTWTKTLTKDRASGIIIKDNKILLIHRFNGDREYWVLPGGSVEEGETAEIALVREMKEELTIEVKEKKKVFTIPNVGREEHNFLIIDYRGEFILGGPEAEKVSETNKYILTWVTIEEFFKLTNFLPENAKDKVLYIWKKLK
ncbi:MAG: mismatch repair protein MutT [Candidatus Nomurabacteria bacterium]|nr:mismatch repair protein MutT [Candidatus Nomurabacteria bacterium]